MAGHSKGPWYVTGSITGYRVHSDDGSSRAIVLSESSTVPNAEDEANAALMAKAWLLPEMADAIDAVLSPCDLHGVVCPDAFQRLSALLDTYRGEQ